jgi:hypothetical protein
MRWIPFIFVLWGSGSFWLFRMILFDPFFLFCAVETMAILGMLFIWFDIDFCYCYLALGGYITPEVHLHAVYLTPCLCKKDD